MKIIIGVIVVVVILAVILMYNSLVKVRTYADESWSQINVQLKRRNDLIPNLINTVKGYAQHEQETFTKVVDLRNQLTDMSKNSDPNPEQKAAMMKTSNMLSDSLKTIFALGENYPDLKANQEFTKLMEELSNTENKIAYSRQLFNSSVARYNIKLQSFPSNIVAKTFGFQAVEYLQVPESETEVPHVSFDK